MEETFDLMAAGKLRPNHNGHYIVENVQVGGKFREPKIEFVTPLAQDIEMAKSELKSMTKKTGTNMARRRRAYKSLKDFLMRPPGIPGYK